LLVSYRNIPTLPKEFFLGMETRSQSKKFIRNILIPKVATLKEENIFYYLGFSLLARRNLLCNCLLSGG
jgi:hypothetical protein